MGGFQGLKRALGVVGVVLTCMLLVACSRGPGLDPLVDIDEHVGEREFPLKWRIGRIDPMFNVTEGQVRSAIEKGIALWETAAGRKLFQYSPDGFPVELIFDERQQRLIAMKTDEEAVTVLRGQCEAASRNYQAAAADLKSRISLYKSALDAHNRNVERSNATGIATEVDVAEFESERTRLQTEQENLARQEQEVEALRQEANRMVDSLNAEVKRYNLSAKATNQQATPVRIGECRFTQSSIGGKVSIQVDAISIYSFHNEAHLAVVLAHELGHAVGVEHVEGDDALMSAVERGNRIPTNLELTARDRAALAKVSF